MTALLHDYRVMNPKKGFLCLNELDFNAPLSPAMATMFRVKLPMTTFRSIILEGKRFPAQQALEAGLVDALGGVEEAIKLAQERGVEGKLRKTPYEGSYGRIKEEIYREIVADLSKTRQDNEQSFHAANADREQRKVEVEKKVKEWAGKTGGVKSKL